MPSDSPYKPASASRFSRVLLATNLAVAALLGAALGLALATSHDAFARQARTVTEDLTSSMGAALASELKLLDNALLTVRAQVSAAGGLRKMGAPNAGSALEGQQQLLPWVPSLRIADAEGVVRLGRGVNAARPPQVSDRAYFKQARDQAGDSVVLSEPVQSRGHGTWGVAVSRALFAPDGTFEGIVYAAVPVAHFEGLLARLELGEKGAVSLRSESLQLIARAAGGRPATGKVGSSNVSPELAQALQRSPQRGFFVSRTALDGIERSNAYQKVESFPLLVLAGLATDDFFAPWRRQAVQLSALVLVILSLLAGSSLLLVRYRRAQLAAMTQIADLAREQSAMLDNELIGIVKAHDRKTLWMNKAMECIFGYTPEELLGHSARMLHPDDASYEALASAYSVMSSGRQFRSQLKMRRKDGELIWIDLTGAMLSATETLWLMADVTLQKRNEEQIRHAALHDALTGLPNRSLLGHRIDAALHTAAQEHQLAAVAMFDLDGFKQVNDRHGHGAGDALLKQVAGRLTQGVRGHDTVFRWGGDEFVVLLTGLTGNEDSVVTLQRLLQDLQRPIAVGDGTMANVGASIGVAFFPGDGNDVDTLMRVADERMYEAKRGGRNRIVSAAEGSRPALQIVRKERAGPV